MKKLTVGLVLGFLCATAMGFVLSGCGTGGPAASTTSTSTSSTSSSTATTTSTTTTTVNGWVRKASLPFARARAASVADNQYVYCLGGFSGDAPQPVNDVTKYDPNLDQWNSITTLPTSREDLCAVLVNGKIYTFGGYDGNFSSTVEIYDIALDQWSTGSPMPTARAGMCAGAAGNEIYISGGILLPGGNQSTVEVYNIVDNSWRTAAAMPMAVYFGTSAMLAGKLYVIGGVNMPPITRMGRMDVSAVISYPTNEVQIYDPASDTWTANLDFPIFSLVGGVAGTIGNKLYVAGGAGVITAGFFSSAEVYSPATGLWNPIAPMLTPSYLGSSAILNNQLYAIGGMNGEFPSYVATNEVQVYTR